jgi:hypothetical protein
MNELQHWLSLYMGVFVARNDDGAVQLPTGRYRRQGRPLTPHDIVQHLAGTVTYGTYVMDRAGCCRFAVFDDDTPDGLSRLAQVQTALLHDGFPSYLEQSRRGGHLWVLLAAPVLASTLRSWLLPYALPGMEFYPKQNEGGGYGSLIRLPLGVHRVSGKRYPFIRLEGGRVVPIASSLHTTLEALATFERVEPPTLAPVAQARTPHTQSFSSFELAPTSRRNDLTIRQWNAAHDPFQVIGHYVSLNSFGVGCCPFGEHHKNGADRHPSFKVYRPGVSGGYCWYCYTWQKGGSIFDFLCLYHGVDARTMWDRLLQQKGWPV